MKIPIVQSASTRPLVPSLLADRLSVKALLCVLLLHVLLLAMFLLAPSAQPVVEEPVRPMLVSLVASPLPQQAISEPKPPQPQPIVKKTAVRQPQVVKQTEQPPAETPQEHISPAQPVAEATPVAAPAAPAKVEEPSALPVTNSIEVVQKPALKEEPIAEYPSNSITYLHEPEPVYPPMSRRLGEQGLVLLRVLVAASGEAESVLLEKGSGFARLDQSAVDAVKKARFVPYRRNNQPVSAYVRVPVRFSLNG